MGMFRNVTGAMGFGMAAGASKLNSGARAAGWAATSAILGSSRMGRATLGGAALGGLYGGTLGRDPGQSRLGGAMTGALGGAALGRYGYRGANRGYLAARFGGGMSSSGMGRLGMGMKAAGKGMFRQVMADGMSAKRHISAGLNKGKGMFFNALGR